jgi:hypothetical protein
MWPVMVGQYSEELARFQRMLDSAFSGGATSSGKPEDRVVFPLLVCCRDIVEEILFALSEGFGRAGLRAVRTMYECVVVARFLHLHPERVDEFLDKFYLQWAKISQNLGPADRSAEFDSTLRKRVPKYAQGKRLGMQDLDWSGKHTFEMAKEAGQLADLHLMAFDLASAYIHPSSLLFMSAFTPGQTENAPRVGESKQEEEAKFAMMLGYDLMLNAVDLRLKYAPSDSLQLLLDECKADFSRIWGHAPHL